jgi:hypothetical protein
VVHAKVDPDTVILEAKRALDRASGGGDTKRLRVGAENEKPFEKCFLFLFGKDHDACALRRMTTERGEGYSYASVEHCLLSYDRESERKTELRGFAKVPYADTEGSLREFADCHAPCVAGLLKGGGHQVVCGRSDAIGLATDYETPAWESMREWLSQSDYNEGYDPAPKDEELSQAPQAEAEKHEKGQEETSNAEAARNETLDAEAARNENGHAEATIHSNDTAFKGSDASCDEDDVADLAELHSLPSVRIEGQVYFVDKDGKMECGVKNLAILETKEKGKYAEPAGIYDADKNVVTRFTQDEALDLFGEDLDAFCAYLSGGGLRDAETGGALQFTAKEAQAIYDAEFSCMPENL